MNRLCGRGSLSGKMVSGMKQGSLIDGNPIFSWGDVAVILKNGCQINVSPPPNKTSDVRVQTKLWSSWFSYMDVSSCKYAQHEHFLREVSSDAQVSRINFPSI